VGSPSTDPSHMSRLFRSFRRLRGAILSPPKFIRGFVALFDAPHRQCSPPPIPARVLVTRTRPCVAVLNADKVSFQCECDSDFAKPKQHSEAWLPAYLALSSAWHHVDYCMKFLLLAQLGDDSIATRYGRLQAETTSCQGGRKSFGP